jgi:hypothetical protein
MSDKCINTPTLAADGSNWVNYRDRLVAILQAKKLADHLVSDVVTARYNAAGNVNGLMPAQRWSDDEDTTLVILNGSIPDAIYTQVKGGTNIKAIWDALRLLFEGRSRNRIMDLTNKL